MDPSGWSVATLGWKAGTWFPLLLIFRSAKMPHTRITATTKL